jgi:hypothetical protein
MEIGIYGKSMQSINIINSWNYFEGGLPAVEQAAPYRETEQVSHSGKVFSGSDFLFRI